MLTPYICVICEKVIIEKIVPPTADVIPDTVGPASLIGLFSKIYISANAPPNTPPTIPANAVVPHNWAIYSEWNAEPGDENRRYFQNVEILYPDGARFGEPAKVPIIVMLNRKSQVIVRYGAFPIGQTGMYTARVSIEENQRAIGEPVNLSIELVALQPGQNPATQQ